MPINIEPVLQMKLLMISGNKKSEGVAESSVLPSRIPRLWVDLRFRIVTYETAHFDRWFNNELNLGTIPVLRVHVIKK